MRRAGVRALAAALAGAAAAPGSALATDHNVAISGFVYEPSPLTVEVGDTVTWRNESFLTHTATAEDGAFDSGTLRAGESFSFKFTTVGDFRYTCTIHRQMHGEVIVKGSGPHQMQTPMPAPSPTTPPVLPPTPVPGSSASGPVGIALSLSPVLRHGRHLLAVSVRVTRPGAELLLELYSREHFSWRQVGHAKAGATGVARLWIHTGLHLPLRIVVPGRSGETPSISQVVHTS